MKPREKKKGELLLTKAQIAKAMNVSERTLQELRCQGMFPDPLPTWPALWDRKTVRDWIARASGKQ